MALFKTCLFSNFIKYHIYYKKPFAHITPINKGKTFPNFSNFLHKSSLARCRQGTLIRFGEDIFLSFFLYTNKI